MSILDKKKAQEINSRLNRFGTDKRNTQSFEQALNDEALGKLSPEQMALINIFADDSSLDRESESFRQMKDDLKISKTRDDLIEEINDVEEGDLKENLEYYAAALEVVFDQ